MKNVEFKQGDRVRIKFDMVLKVLGSTSTKDRLEALKREPNVYKIIGKKIHPPDINSTEYYLNIPINAHLSDFYFFNKELVIIENLNSKIIIL